MVSEQRGQGRRLAITGILVVALVAVIAIAVWSGREKDNGDAIFGGGDLTTVTGVIGSEKAPFFADPEVKRIFAEHGLDVQVSTAGSRQIAHRPDLGELDFVFPSSAPAAEKIMQSTSGAREYSPFYSPMAVATYEPIVQLLGAEGVIRDTGNGAQYLDMHRYLEIVDENRRWRDLRDGPATFNSPRTVLINSTDIRLSNSAAMYLAIASFVHNGEQVVGTPEEATTAADALARLFLDQGYTESSSAGPFGDYLSQGMGAMPLVMVYEAQYLGRQIEPTLRGQITDQMRLVYPEPTVLSKHVVVALTDPGRQVGEMLTTVPELARMAAHYGFRPEDAGIFREVLDVAGVAHPPELVNVVNPPRYDLMEQMISQVEDRFAPGQPPTTSEAADAVGAPAS